MHKTWIKKAKQRKLVLHIGEAKTGLHKRFYGKEYYVVRAAFSPALKPDILLSKMKLSALPEALFDAVWLADCLEYMRHQDVQLLIQDTLHCLKDIGEWGMIVPDAEALSAYIANGRAQEIVAHFSGEGMSAWHYLFGSEIAPHQSFYNAEKLARLLRDIGMGNTTIEQRQNALWVGAVIYPKQHKNYIGKVQIRKAVPASTPLELPPVARQPHPGLFLPGTLPDALDIPPKQYEGLKH